MKRRYNPPAANLLDDPLDGSPDGGGELCIGCGIRVMPTGASPCELLGTGPVCPGIARQIDAALCAQIENAPHREAGGDELEVIGGGETSDRRDGVVGSFAR
jgi:hypothetical protein